MMHGRQTETKKQRILLKENSDVYINQALKQSYIENPQ